jgi:hypothetical protein
VPRRSYGRFQTPGCQRGIEPAMPLWALCVVLLLLIYIAYQLERIAALSGRVPIAEPFREFFVIEETSLFKDGREFLLGLTSDPFLCWGTLGDRRLNLKVSGYIAHLMLDEKIPAIAKQYHPFISYDAASDFFEKKKPLAWGDVIAEQVTFWKVDADTAENAIWRLANQRPQEETDETVIELGRTKLSVLESIKNAA